MVTDSWQTIAASKRARNAALIPTEWLLPSPPSSEVRNVINIPRTCGVLTDKEAEITEQHSVSGLVGEIAKGTYSAVEVTTAFCKRAAIAQQLTNCLTEVFFDKAIERAKELDEHYAKTGKTVGPLHGLPVSLKDQIEVKGTEFTMSYVGWVGKVAEHDAVIAELLLKQGAVFYVRTNMSQGLWFGEGNNNVFGRTLNPFNRNLTCGGSSGGEGALIGMRGSLLGVGSDVGGSVRIPAAYQGLYGLRPSYCRQEIVRSVLGPLTTSLDGLKLFVQSILAASPWEHDPWTPRMPWSHEAYSLRDHGGEGGKLCFAIMWDDGVVKPVAPYTRALEETKKALLAAGHEVIDWEPFKSAEAGEIISAVFNADGGRDIRHQLSLSGEPQLGAVLSRTASEMGVYDFFALCHRRTGFIKDALDHWNGTVSRTSTGRAVDGIIAPASACAPSRHDAPMYIGYTSFSNLADYATAIIPVTQVDPAVDVAPPAHEFRNEQDKFNYEQYDPEYYRDAPISLQVIGKKYEEEAVIRMTEIIASALGKV
ncbi:Acetamidase [Saitozyma sp. JCM 24511]|nr:Acetamidase [Saitozyma sp. JCM 24511]